MDRSDIRELHFITPIANLGSILKHGILSNDRASQLQHADVSMSEIQERRARILVPDVRLQKPRRLHEYANVYIDARNLMMYKRHEMHEDLCVVRVSHTVLDREGVVVTDGNAASDVTRFLAAPEGLAEVDKASVFARSWNHPDPNIKRELGRRRCAEVLVPDLVPPELIEGAYVSCANTAEACQRIRGSLLITRKRNLFFQ